MSICEKNLVLNFPKIPGMDLNHSGERSGKGNASWDPAELGFLPTSGLFESDRLLFTLAFPRRNGHELPDILCSWSQRMRTDDFSPKEVLYLTFG